MRPFEEIKLFIIDSIKEAFIEVKEKLFQAEKGLKKVETRLDSIEKNDQKVKESQKENKKLRKSLQMIQQDFKKAQIIQRKVIRKTKKNLKEIETIKNQQENRLKNLPPPRPRIITNNQIQVLEKVVLNDSDPENISDSSSEECGEGNSSDNNSNDNSDSDDGFDCSESEV